MQVLQLRAQARAISKSECHMLINLSCPCKISQPASLELQNLLGFLSPRLCCLALISDPGHMLRTRMEGCQNVGLGIQIMPLKFLRSWRQIRWDKHGGMGMAIWRLLMLHVITNQVFREYQRRSKIITQVCKRCKRRFRPCPSNGVCCCISRYKWAMWKQGCDARIHPERQHWGHLRTIVSSCFF